MFQYNATKYNTDLEDQKTNIKRFLAIYVLDIAYRTTIIEVNKSEVIGNNHTR